VKITEIKTHFVDRYLFVTVHTDSGPVGYGESGAWGFLEASAGAVDTFTRGCFAGAQWSVYVELSVGRTGGASIGSLPQPYKGGGAMRHISLDSPLSMTALGEVSWETGQSLPRAIARTSASSIWARSS